MQGHEFMCCSYCGSPYCHAKNATVCANEDYKRKQRIEELRLEREANEKKEAQSD